MQIFKNKTSQTAEKKKKKICTYNEYLSESSNSISAAWLPQR